MDTSVHRDATLLTLFLDDARVSSNSEERHGLSFRHAATARAGAIGSSLMFVFFMLTLRMHTLEICPSTLATWSLCSCCHCTRRLGQPERLTAQQHFMPHILHRQTRNLVSQIARDKHDTASMEV